MEKGKPISVRLTTEERERLSEEAKMYGYATVSSYVRYKIVDSQNEILSNNPYIYAKVCKELVKIHYFIDKLPEDMKYHKEDLSKGVYEIWHTLNS